MSFLGMSGKRCKIRCPKCRKQNLWLSEVWNDNGIYFKVTEGIMPEEAEDHFQGAPVCVIATCIDCKHNWKVRKATNVMDLVIDED